MRRSRMVVAPLLAATAVTVMAGCHGDGEASALVQHDHRSSFGGFGESFREHPVVWLWAGFMGFLILRRRGAGG